MAPTKNITAELILYAFEFVHNSESYYFYFIYISFVFPVNSAYEVQYENMNLLPGS